MANEREWVPMEVLWDAASPRGDDYPREEQTADEIGGLSRGWPGFPRAPQDEAHLSRRKRKKLRGENQQFEH